MSSTNSPEHAHTPARTRREPPEPATRAEARILEDLHEELGAAFDVYLEYIWNGQAAIVDMEADFHNLHWASYEHIEQFAEDFIDALGWNDARDELARTWAIPKNIITFDKQEFLTQLQRDFEFHTRGGQTHVFVK